MTINSSLSYMYQLLKDIFKFYIICKKDVANRIDYYVDRSYIYIYIYNTSFDFAIK